MIEHKCEEMNKLQEGFDDGYGQAVTEIYKTEKARLGSGFEPDDTLVWVASNGEYATRIDYCPFCGKKL